MYAAFLVGGLFLTSCGSGGDVAADAEKICACLEAAKKDPSKAEECAKISTEMDEKYKNDIDGKAAFAAKIKLSTKMIFINILQNRSIFLSKYLYCFKNDLFISF